MAGWRCTAGLIRRRRAVAATGFGELIRASSGYFLPALSSRTFLAGLGRPGRGRSVDGGYAPAGWPERSRRGDSLSMGSGEGPLCAAVFGTVARRSRRGARPARPARSERSRRRREAARRYAPPEAGRVRGAAALLGLGRSLICSRSPRTSLQTLVTKSSQPRENLVRVYEGHSRRCREQTCSGLIRLFHGILSLSPENSAS